jgi:hemerythrin superfamily protein
MPAQSKDVLDQLEQEHRTVESLVEGLADSEPGKGRRELVARLSEVLDDHMAFEESRLYPVLEDLDEEAVVEAANEHDLAREGLGRLSDLTEEPGFGAAVEMLRAGISHHVAEEEHEVFPRLRRDAADRIEQLDRDGAPDGDGQAGDGEPTRDDLYRAAREAGVEGRSTMTKAELADALDQN